VKRVKTSTFRSPEAWEKLSQALTREYAVVGGVGTLEQGPSGNTDVDEIRKEFAQSVKAAGRIPQAYTKLAKKLVAG
jgi:putative NADH-flavin reductase